ncbi:hypothetical protein [Pelomicrobium sp.]|jgi:hypothetical protein|uniref:hypothetical protein n=1 Tax=Pelomicrobium sp. TaxID=2815319 RepID=UPI002FDE4B3E
MKGEKKPLLPLALSGAGSGGLYLLLFLFEEEVLRATTRTDGLAWLLPVAMAFVFSLVHGAFTGYFWETLGIRGKPQGKGKR